jgi:hypothetical protein
LDESFVTRSNDETKAAYEALIQQFFKVPMEQAKQLANDLFEILLAKGSSPQNPGHDEEVVKVIVGKWLGKSPQDE